MFNFLIFLIELLENIIIDYEISVSCFERIKYRIYIIYIETGLLRSYNNNPNTHKRSVFSANVYGGQIEDDHIPFLNYGNFKKKQIQFFGKIFI
jgi:hypothetical protein